MALRVLVCVVLICGFSVELSGSLRIYVTTHDPKDNPDYDRYAVKHPTPATFGNTTKFATFREFQIDRFSLVVNYTDDLKKYCLDPSSSLGSVIWPMYPLLYSTNFKDVISSVAHSKLYVTDIWAFVPGSGPGNGSRWRENVWQQFYPPADVLSYLETILGEKWFGMDIGEQDGRYIGSYAEEMIPLNSNTKHQYLNFREHFKAMEDILGPKLVALVSLTYPHYMIKTGLYTMVGAEAAQALPNSQVFYAFIRGAGKQYGVMWFGNVSVYNRFGYKTYPGTAPLQDLTGNEKVAVTRNYTCSSQGQGGPSCGTSLNLMKRLLYAHMLYGSGYVSFENGWFIGDSSELSPIGKIQHAAQQFTSSKKSFGVHVATVGLYLDFFNGFTPPRHLYSSNLYRAWGNLPYSDGDFLTDEVLRLVYPQYQDSSYFHDETGFSSATPFCDTLDVVLSDSPTWVLSQYDTVIVSSNISGGHEVKNNLKDYVLAGGNLVITSANLAQLPNGILGVNATLNCNTIPGGAKVIITNGGVVREKCDMNLCGISFPENATILGYLEDSTPVAVQVMLRQGGSITVFVSPYAVCSSLVTKPASNVDETLSSPYPLLEHTKVILSSILSNASLFRSSANLSILPTFIGGDEFMLLVTNPNLKQQPLNLTSVHGGITYIEEVQLDQSEKGAQGYLPDGFQGTDIGKSTNTTIAGGDTRLFVLKLSAPLLHILPKLTPKPRPNGIALHLRSVEHSIRKEILFRPSFFQHYDSVVVDYSYVMAQDTDYLVQEKHWMMRQNISVFVDASPAINLFPNIRLVNNSAVPYKQSLQLLEDLLIKMSAMGSVNLIVSLHRVPENDYNIYQTLESSNTTLHYLLSYASRLGICIHLQDTLKTPITSTLDLAMWLENSGLNDIKLVLNTAILLDQTITPVLENVIDKHSSLILINSPGFDLFGARYSVNIPVKKGSIDAQNKLKDLILRLCTIRGYCPYQKEYSRYPLVVDGYFTNPDDEYHDVKYLEELLYVSDGETIQGGLGLTCKNPEA